ncbi:PREDICTED: E3 ubiquitin-protein ligase MARCH4 [Nanorana parkeri]|uniref:E3 ubiquitin-protein ligase MARCH4 n=1 Tax=Nanorana parkeri TaxID=125878 RepID=UPI000854E84F|nr:PREDICTED: E3 ubiquitin-protein ligase MARCH4 [Nanorana parkeri]
MFLRTVLLLWCCGLLSPRQMSRHQGLLKCRCRMLFNDLKVLLLRRPPQTPSLPMNSTECDLGAGGALAANNNTLTALGRAWRVPGSGATSEEDWCYPATAPGLQHQPTSVVSSTSSDEFYKGKNEDRYSLGSLDSGMRTPLCRICFQGPEQGELLSPCRCDGSVKCSHQPCLIKWVSERGSWSCELCYYKYHVIAISTKNPLQVKWQAISLTVIEKVQIAAAILGSLFLIASISWLIWSTFSPSAKWQRQDLLFQICYGMYGFMDIVCIGLIIHEGPSVYRIFKRWQAVNQQWKILNYDKSKDLEDQKLGTSHRPSERNSSQTNNSATAAGTANNSTPVDSGNHSNGHAGTLSDHHCAYTLFHILSHLRPHEQRSRSNANREFVMRVTTV